MLLLRALPLLLLLWASISRADAETMPFSPFSATYRGEANGLSVKDLGSRSLVSLGQERFRIEYNAKAMIYSMQETSEFLWENGMPKPISYDSTRGTFLKKRKSNIQFNWDSGKGNYVHKDKRGQFKLTEGIQDPLSSTLLLALEVQSGKASIRFREAKGKDQDMREFDLLDTPVLDSPMGKIKTYHLKRLHDDDQRHTEIWLHFEYPYIPVKVKQTDEDDHFLLELTGFKLQ